MEALGVTEREGGIAARGLEIGSMHWNVHVEDLPPARAQLWLILQRFPKENIPDSHRAWKFSLLQSVLPIPCGPQFSKAQCGCLWILGNIFISGSVASISQSLSCHGSHAAADTTSALHWGLAPCNVCLLLGWPPLCFCKTRKMVPVAPLCWSQVPVHTIPKYLRSFKYGELSSNG